MLFKEQVEEAAKGLNLRGLIIEGGQGQTRTVIQFLNDDDKYEQIELMPEDFRGRDETSTVDGVRMEIARKLEAGEKKILN